MKKLCKSFLILMLSLIITISTPLSAFAYEYTTPDLDAMVQVKENGNTEIRSISERSIKQIRNSRSSKYKNKTDTEKLKDIFDALGFNLTDLQFEEINKELKFSHISNISVETQYLKVDAEGDSSYISKDEALEMAAEEEALLAVSQENYDISATSDTSPTAWHSGPLTTSDDGCVEMQVSAIYTPNYNGTGTTIGRYCFLGACSWIKTPSTLTRSTDAICLYSRDFNWYDQIMDSDKGSNYISMFSYTESYYDANGTLIFSEDFLESKYDDEAVVSAEKGAFFTYKLPKDKLLAPSLCYNFTFLIFGVGLVHDYDDYTQGLEIDLQYTHLRNSLSISPSFSWGSVGVSVEQLITPKIYYAHHAWDYKDDFFA